ncbi:MAG: tetratricopeptide repeat protein [Myxococcaceae bacterium]|nr:tetratricopeptide repeat protein [Myxococcaceae bacterium]
MTGRALVPILCAFAWPALADEVADKALTLNKEGTALAEQGRFDEAITRFKAAEVLLPRYQHHCNIGIAYQDSGRLPQAQRFLQSCVARAGKNASPAVKARLVAVEAAVKAGAFGVVVVRGASVRVAFAPAFDELWVVDGQRRFPVPAGVVELAVSSLTGATWSKRVDVTAGDEVSVDLGSGSVPSVPTEPVAERPPEPAPTTLEPVVDAPAPAVAPAPVATTISSAPPAPAPSRRLTPWLLIGGGALAGLGVATFFAAQSVGRTLGPTADLTGYRALVVTTYSAWGLGALAGVAGLVLAVLPWPVESALLPLPAPGGLVVSWSARFASP